MSVCNITIKLGKEELVFHSDEELDSFLMSHSSELERLSKLYRIQSDAEFDKIFSMSEEQDQAISKIEKIKEAYQKAEKEATVRSHKKLSDTEIIKDLEEFEHTEHIKNSISVSNFIEKVGNIRDISKPQVTGMNLKYESSFKQKLREDGFTEDEINKAWEREQFKGVLSAYAGEDVHYILETKFRQIEDPSLTIDTSKFQVLTEEDFAKYEPILNKIVEDIKARFPDAKFYPEFEIVSNTLPSSIIYQLEHYRINAKTANGRIDLLVIDKDGVAHIFDWKVSSKHVGNWKETSNKIVGQNGWWPTTKKFKAFAQVGNYSAMLEQYGLEVEAPEIIPFYIEFELADDGKPIKKVQHFERDLLVGKNDDGSVMTEIPYTTAYKRYAEYNFAITKQIEIKELRNNSDILAILFPGTNINEGQVKHFQASLDFYKNKPNFKKPVAEGTEAYKKGYRYVFYKNQTRDKGPVYCKDNAEFEEKLGEYIEDLNSFVSTQMINFATDLSKVMHNGGEDTNLINTWLADFNESQQAYLKNQFRKYYINSWYLVVNEELNNNGIFLFQKNDQIDIVVLSEKDLHYIYELVGKNGKKTHTVLGGRLNDDEEGTDRYKVMSSQYGNMLLMKVAALLSQNPELISDRKINTIKVINPWQEQETLAHSNDYFINTWNSLVPLYPELHLHLLNTNQFFDDIDRCLHEATEALLSENVGDIIRDVKTNGTEKYHDEEHLRSLLDVLERKFPNTYNIIQTREGYAYNQIQKALVHIFNVHIYEEPDRGQYFNNGLLPTGTAIDNGDSSMSNNIRALRELFSYYRNDYTETFNKFALPFVKLCEDVYKEWGFNERTDNPRDFWAEHFLEKDENGNVRPEMLLMNPNNSHYEGKPASKKWINYITQTLATFRFPNVSEEDLEIMIGGADEGSKYYQVPLMRTTFGDFLRQTYQKGSFKAVAKGLWDRFRTKGSDFMEYISGVNDLKNSFAESEGKDIVENSFLHMSQKQRNDLISDPSRAWDYDLRFVMLDALSKIAITESSKRYGIAFTAFRAALNYAIQVGNINNKELFEGLDKWIRNKVFMKQIRTESLDVLNSIISVMKSASSVVTLGLSTRNFTKEMLTQMYISLTRSSTHQILDITAKDFADGVWFVAKEAPVSINKTNFMAFLNQRFAMSNYSRTEMAEMLRRTYFGLQNLRTGDVFIGTKLPDDWYRLGILVAKMMHDGVFSAYEPNNDTWKYNIHKDKRFNKFLANDKSDLKEYAKQKNLFEKFVNEWNIANPDIDYKSNPELIPDAYTPKQKASIRGQAGDLYGHFDVEDKSLLTATFLGGAFMQYKTWLSAKLNQWIKAPGYINRWRQYQKTDENGKKLWLVGASEEELNKGVDPIRYITEDDPDLDKYISEDRAVPWIVEEGTWNEGMIQATGEFLSNILTWNIDEFKLNWENPIKRGQLINGLTDTLGLLLFAGIIKLLFGEDVVNNRREQDWITQWTYGVLMGFANDGPIHQVLGSTISDLNPPSFIALKQWAQTANSVLAGSKSVGQGIVETFGATRELRGYFYTMI